MRTYAEKRGEKPFDWNAFLDKAINGNIEYDGKQHEKTAYLAGMWVTCACGNQCNAIPRFPKGQPMDEVLSDLGCEFSIRIDNGHWEEAKGILMEIEKRSIEIIDQINKTNDGNSN